VKTGFSRRRQTAIYAREQPGRAGDARLDRQVGRIAAQVARQADWQHVAIHADQSIGGHRLGLRRLLVEAPERIDLVAVYDYGIERVNGSVGGRSGTFPLQDAGTVDGNTVSGDWFMVPGSGTGELAGLHGEGGFRANLGEGAQVHLDYWFE
jgi:Protein of unknown function (DUF3224)